MVDGPLDVGSVLQIGAGGVGLSFDYWLREFGVVGKWRVADGDPAALHNTNRTLGLFPHDAGWPGGSGRNKATIAAELFGAEAIPHWYHEIDLDSFRPDLILPLANEHEVRRFVGARGEPLVLHATTSRTWESQLHRHIPDRDDCIVCRMPEPLTQVQLTCATVPLQGGTQQSTDAALPFLSATAGLLLLSGLFRLQYGVLDEDEKNLWCVCFKDVRRHARVGTYKCREGCQATLIGSARRRIAPGRRWSHIDPATA
jgi:hypothetical protein